ncbi:MAG: conserved rane protein of unknown function [Candidatus Saccharibacteria bacterium]|nr:conserved rane protein of unknown function [Candidatus Saccharibacteria bacterium]
MTFLVIFLLVVATLFIIAFITKRRYGVLGLALAAGAMLSTLWVGDLTPIIAQAGLVLIKPPLESVVASTLTLLPALLLLTSGPAYHTTFQRVSGALLFAVLATVLLLEPLGSALVIEGTGKDIYNFLVTNRVMIITTCLILAISDILFTRTPKIARKH